MNFKVSVALTLAFSTALISGCNFEESGGDSDSGLPSIQLNANSGWAYLSFSAGREVQASDDWQLAFKATDVRSNTAITQLDLAAAQDDFYGGNPLGIESVFRSATAADEEEHLLETYDSLSFARDNLDTAIGRDNNNFYTFTGGAFSANSDNWWLVKSAEGDGFGKLHVTDVSYNSSTHEVTVEAEVFFKEAGGDYGSAINWISRSHDKSTLCFDFDSAQTVSCNSDAWDLQYTTEGTSALFILTNGGFSGDGSGGVYTASSNRFAMTKSEIDALDTDSLANEFVQDAEDTDNMFAQNTWYQYSGMWDGFQTHNILPNFRTYALEDEATGDIYLFQITSYYNEAAQSGHPTVTYRRQD